MRTSMLMTIVFAISLGGCETPKSQALKPDIELTGQITLLEEEISDYDPSTGVGCTVTPRNSSKKIHILCRSKRSQEISWDAVTGRSKLLCKSQKWGMYFNLPAVLPKEGDVYRSQVVIECVS